MDSLRKNNSNRRESAGNIIDIRNAKNNQPKNPIDSQNFSHIRSSFLPEIKRDESIRRMNPNMNNKHEVFQRNIPNNSSTGLGRESKAGYPDMNILPKKYADYDQAHHHVEEKIKEKSEKKIRIIFSLALFFMIAVFVVAIGWYEFHSNDNSLEKMLSKNTTATDKTTNLDAKTNASAANTAAQAQAKAAQAQAAQQKQAASAETENINTGTTSPEETSDTESTVTKTYKNEKGEISFDYPSEYKIEESNGQVVASKSKTMWRMKIYENNDKKEIKDWFDAYFSDKDNTDCDFIDSGTLKIGTLTTKLAKIKTDVTEGKCEGIGYYALNSDKTKVVRVRLDEADETEANKILSSFKFTK